MNDTENIYNVYVESSSSTGLYPIDRQYEEEIDIDGNKIYHCLKGEHVHEHWKKNPKASDLDADGLHRLDGPALIYEDDYSPYRYYIEGKALSRSDHEKATKYIKAKGRSKQENPDDAHLYDL